MKSCPTTRAPCVAKALAIPLLAVLATVAPATPVVEPLTWRSDAGPPVEPHAADGDDATLPRTAHSDPGEHGASDLPTRQLYIHKGVRDMLAAMESFEPVRQRVKIRAVEQHFFPVIYPAYHWLPWGMRENEIVRSHESGERSLTALWEESGACYLCDEHYKHDLVGLLGLLNVRIYHSNRLAARGAVSCCNPYADLVLAMTTEGGKVREIRVPMHQTEPGNYHIDDPIGIANEILTAIEDLDDGVPLMTVAAVLGTGYKPFTHYDPVDYAIRWGEIELEYGSHYTGDPEGVVR